MCDVAYDAQEAEVFNETTVTARRAYRCSECGMRILRGTQHTKISMLAEGQWSTFRAHTDCYSLLTHIAFTVCKQPLVYVACERLRNRVREHMGEHREVLEKYRTILRARRAEGVWPDRLNDGHELRA